MANETVTYDLATVLSEMRADIKQIQTTQTTILLNQTKLEGKIDTLETEMKTGQDGLAKRLDNIEMLIRIIIGGATVTFVGGIFTFLFSQLKNTL